MATRKASKAAGKTETKGTGRTAPKKASVPSNAVRKRAASKATKSAEPKSMPKGGRNPKGGLTQAGRDFFAKRDGSHLKPSVTGPANTPEKMMRKGSFLVRTFTHPRGPMVDPQGEPTRLALSAHAWGEKVPKSISEAHKLAAKGHQLLAKYHEQQERAGASKPEKTATAKTSTAKAAGAKGVKAAKKASVKNTGKSAKR